MSDESASKQSDDERASNGQCAITANGSILPAFPSASGEAPPKSATRGSRRGRPSGRGRGSQRSRRKSSNNPLFPRLDQITDIQPPTAAHSTPVFYIDWAGLQTFSGRSTKTQTRPRISRSEKGIDRPTAVWQVWQTIPMSADVGMGHAWRP